MADLQQIGRALQGFGAGVRGRGPEFIQGLQTQRKQLSDERRDAALLDNRVLLDHLKSGRVPQARQLLTSRLQTLQQIDPNADPSDTQDMLNLIDIGQIPLLTSEAEVVDREAVIRGLLPALETQNIESEKLVIRREELAARQAADKERAAVQREKIAATKQANRQKVAAERQAIEAKKQAAILANDVKLESQAKIETQKLNIKRIGELSQGAKAREDSIKKARQFMRSLDPNVVKTKEDLFGGLEAESGASRTFAGFIPGVFTDQGAFDQKFNSFAEVAARQQLKASGEIRPTDADVEGMKRAMFGVGRDEPVNVQLLQEFIDDQVNLDEELEDLREAKAQGRLNEFTGSQPATLGLPPGTIDNGNGTFTLPTGETVRPR